jgi:general L-amino acid transport system permease protein
MAKSSAPPAGPGWLTWIQDNFFSSWSNAALTVAGVALLVLVVVPFADWAVVRAVWTGDSGAVCRQPGVGACWPYIGAWFDQFVYYQYTQSERWRADIVFLSGALGLAWLMIPRLPAKFWVAVAMLTVFPLMTFALLSGHWLGLEIVPTQKWGGFLLTLVISGVAIVVSIPAGILLALARRSELPVIRILATVFIEVIRGTPLVAVLFVGLYIIPLFLPGGITFDNLAAGLVAISIFSAAYMAEAIRGGLQAVPKGQYEAAAAMGLGYWKATGLVVLPQAMKISLPSIVSNVIGIFKDTSLVAIIGLTDLLHGIQKSGADPVWNSPSTPFTGYVFAAMVFWTFCFGMSRYAAYLEDTVAGGKIGTGKT